MLQVRTAKVYCVGGDGSEVGLLLQATPNALRHGETFEVVVRERLKLFASLHGVITDARK